MNPYEKFIKNFRHDLAEVMQRKNLAQTDINKIYGVSQAPISNFLRGQRGLSVKSIIALWPLVYGQTFPMVKTWGKADAE